MRVIVIENEMMPWGLSIDSVDHEAWDFNH